MRLTTLAFVVLGVVATAQIMALFLPNWYAVRERDHGVPNRKGVRDAVIAGGSLALAVAVLGSVLSRDATPVIGALAGTAAVYAAYMWAIEHPHGGTSG